MVDKKVGRKAEGLMDEAAGRVKGAVGGLKGDVGAQIEGKVEELSGKAKREFADLYDAHETKLEAVTGFVQERPLVTLAIVALVGLVIGRLLFRRSA